MSKVFIVQRPAYFDSIRGGWVNKYDFTPASYYGDIVFLLPHGNIYRSKLQGVIEVLNKSLANFTTNDFVLMIGDPVAIATTIMIASTKTNGCINILKFDRKLQEYNSYSINLNNG